jgi:hypothetical protein
MRKFRASISMEPFWDLKISKYVKYLTPVSSEYLIGRELLSLTSITLRVFLACVIPWINKASLVLYIAHIAQRAMTNWSEVWKLYFVIEFVPVVEASKLVTIEVESWSQAVSLRLRRHCVHTILMTFYHMHHYRYAATGDMVKISILDSQKYWWG